MLYTTPVIIYQKINKYKMQIYRGFSLTKQLNWSIKIIFGMIFPYITRTKNET
jgi:hypothetical protein